MTRTVADIQCFSKLTHSLGKITKLLRQCADDIVLFEFWLLGGSRNKVHMVNMLANSCLFTRPAVLEHCHYSFVVVID